MYIFPRLIFHLVIHLTLKMDEPLSWLILYQAMCTIVLYREEGKTQRSMQRSNDLQREIEQRGGWVIRIPWRRGRKKKREREKVEGSKLIHGILSQVGGG